MTLQSEVIGNPKYVPVLDHGFVGLLDVMGSDAEICEAARCSYGKGTKSVSQDRGLIRHLIRNLHTSPIEMGEVKFHLKMPIFVMRQHVRHRTASLNEYSGRYSEMTDEMYLPEPSRLQEQSTSNKQGSGGELTWARKTFCQNLLLSSYEKAFTNYQNTLNLGLSRELARIQLPVANYTELYWKIDLKNFFHYIRLRDDPHAQYEIRAFARAMYDLAKPYFPLACEAFEDYWKNGMTMSASEMRIMKGLLKYLISEVGEGSTAMELRKLILMDGKLKETEEIEFRAKFDLDFEG